MKQRTLLVVIVLTTIATNIGLHAAQPFYNTVLGTMATALADAGVAVGYGARAGQDSTSIGYNAWGDGSMSVTIGSGAYSGGSTASENVNVGDDNKVVNANDVGAASVGRAVWANKLSSVLGHHVYCAPEASCVGEGVDVHHFGSIAIGRGAKSDREYQMSIGSSGDPIREIKIVGLGGTAMVMVGSGDPNTLGYAYNGQPGSLFLRTDPVSYTGPRLYLKRTASTWDPVF